MSTIASDYAQLELKVAALTAKTFEKLVFTELDPGSWSVKHKASRNLAARIYAEGDKFAIKVAKPGASGLTMSLLKHRFSTLDTAKIAVAAWFAANPDWVP